MVYAFSKLLEMPWLKLWTETIIQVTANSFFMVLYIALKLS
jgi:hypothetical protein